MNISTLIDQLIKTREEHGEVDVLRPIFMGKVDIEQVEVIPLTYDDDGSAAYTPKHVVLK
tara:strand:+ start:118 stop:297 length:180 start_codon:yes stop_codon:yes gene_type:complete